MSDPPTSGLAERNGFFVDQRGDAKIWAEDAESSFIRLVWQEAYECGEPTIDQEHQQLFESGELTVRGFASVKIVIEAFRSEFNKLLLHIVRHFANEEALLARHDYKISSRIVSRTLDWSRGPRSLRRRLRTGKAKLGDLVEFVANTVVAQHMFKTDRQFFSLFGKHERQAMRRDLAIAVSGNELSLHYQPQAQIGGDIFGLEALVRWRHRTRGMVYPDIFIPLAEETGLILPIGEWVLREACSGPATSWSNPLTVAVNLSPIQFRHEDLAGLIHAILLETGLPPNRLELEITEGVLLDDLAARSPYCVVSRISAFASLWTISGPVTLPSLLPSFPFDKIKIDRSFS